MVMVKAFSYGSGSYEIANALQFHRVDYLGVAYADEGIELRKSGITLPVMIMNPEPKIFDQLITYYLEPELYSLRILHQFLQFISGYREKFPEGYPVHLELETGMNRLGFGENDLPELLPLISESKLLRIQSVFTHLAASEDAGLDSYTRMQIERFQRMSEQIMRSVSYPVTRHALNSAGIIRFPESHFDMVRLGIGLYGFDATEKIQSQLKQVSTLKTIISQIKKIKTGETIGYGRMGMADQPMTIATVGIGYADGLNRSLSCGEGKMLVRGKLATIVGNICMDMTMIDITEIPEAEEGDEVIVFGKELTVQQMAQSAKTIPYEIISTISRRVKRIYYQE
jgi:alanine racemase